MVFLGALLCFLWRDFLVLSSVSCGTKCCAHFRPLKKMIKNQITKNRILLAVWWRKLTDSITKIGFAKLTVYIMYVLIPLFPCALFVRPPNVASAKHWQSKPLLATQTQHFIIPGKIYSLNETLLPPPATPSIKAKKIGTQRGGECDAYFFSCCKGVPRPVQKVPN